MTERGSTEHPHEHAAPDDLGVDDILSGDRTALSNERTLLAYIRTALTFAVSGASAIQFLDGGIIDVIGYALVVAGVITGILGCDALPRGSRARREYRGGIAVAAIPPSQRRR